MWSVSALVMLALGCDGPSAIADAAVDGGRMDASAADAGPGDAGPPDGGADGGTDAGMMSTPDGGPDRPPATACDPLGGVECDGDWASECDPACPPSDCCVPRATLGADRRTEATGVFRCMPRDESGECPAADIWVDTSRIVHPDDGDQYTVGWERFAADDCAIVEGCVEAPGLRRLLRFDTWTPNTGEVDLYLGDPDDSPELFEYSSCHDHNHFNSYARYSLHDASGAVVARGHKQAFCLIDYYQYPGTDDTGAVYPVATCRFQGIQSGWQDVYGSHLDCQWVDVTDVAPGTYTLRIELNYDGVLLESDYTNNRAEVTVVIPGEADVTAPCPSGTESSADRSCGLTLEGTHTCTPGAELYVGCSSQCDLGACTGDPFMRVCDSASPSCEAPDALDQNDDAGCAAGRCRTSNPGACCPRTTVTCPASGSIDVFYGAYDPDNAATCSVAIAPAP
jgi:hypothetical protein